MIRPLLKGTTLMNAYRRTRAALAASLLVLAATAPAFAQQKQIRVAVVDPSRVFNEMLETKELRGALESERQRLQATARRRKPRSRTSRSSAS